MVSAERAALGAVERRARIAALAVGAAAAAGSGGCTLITDSFLTNEFSGDPHPIEIEADSGAIVVGVRQAARPDRIAVVDLLSPFTLSDPGPGVAPSVSYVDLTLLGRRVLPGEPVPTGPLDLSATVARARFREAQVVALHPCPDETDDGMPNPSCTIGAPGATRAFESIIGADALAGDAVRLRLGDNQMFVLADIGGGDRGRTLSCDAVFNSPYRGGGTLVIAGTELPFGNRRITLQACLGPAADPGPTPYPDGVMPEERGASALLVMSTSIGISILGRTAYERYRIEVGGPAFDELPADEVHLPSGRVRNGRRATIDRIALVGTSTSNQLAPCRQVYAHRFLSARNCNDGDVSTDRCPCKSGSAFCTTPGMIAFEPEAGIDVLVVPDDDPTLQALRTELRPDQPEVDGLLGTSVLRSAEIDVDYPHDRLVARCAQTRCTARPQLAEEEDRDQLMGCLVGQPTGPITRE